MRFGMLDGCWVHTMVGCGGAMVRCERTMEGAMVRCDGAMVRCEVRWSW